MAGRIIPITDITAQSDKMRVFTEEAYDLFHAARGYEETDDFTFTFRISLDLDTEEGRAERDYIMGRLYALNVDGAEELIMLLDEHAWDVSFLADFF